MRQKRPSCKCKTALKNKWRGRRDSNPRPPDRQSGALTNCATSPRKNRGNLSNTSAHDKRHSVCGLIFLQKNRLAFSRFPHMVGVHGLEPWTQ